MKCSKARKLINEYIDNNLSHQQNVSLKKHLDGCQKCQKILEDFQKITDSVKELEDLSPSDQAWFKIQARVKAEKQTARTTVPGFGENLKSFFSPPRLRYVFSAAFLVLLVVAITIFGLRYWKPEEALTGIDQQQFALTKLAEAEHHYQLAIKALWQAVASQEKDFDPQLYAVFQKNLEIIDTFLAACKLAVLNDPEDVESRNYLLTMYKEKTNLLSDMIAVQTNSFPKGELDRIF